MKAQSSSSSSIGNRQHLPHIPPEVLTQILAKLPAKALLRFRCVCKCWRSMIDDPDFVDMHRKLCEPNVANNNNNKLLLSYEMLGGHGNEGCVLTVRDVGTPTITSSHILTNRCKMFYLYGRCNGLLLMCHFDDPHNEMSIWNPSIRKALKLPPSPFLLRWCPDLRWAFGFDPQSMDYKVIVVMAPLRSDPEATVMSVAVYTLSDRQWTVRNNGLCVSLLYFRRMFKCCCYESPGYYWKGAVHWFGNDPCGDGGFRDKPPTHLVSLDLQMEIFTFLELPKSPGGGRTFWFMIHIGESLAVFCISGVSSSIWVLEEDNGKGVWRLWFSGQSSHAGFDLLEEHTYELGTVYYHETVDGRHLLCGKESYNLDTCQVEKLHTTKGRNVDFQIYSESLVLCKKYGAEDLRNFRGRRE